MNQQNQPAQPNISQEPQQSQPSPQSTIQPGIPQKQGLPTWGIIMIVVGTIIVLAGASYGIYCFFASQSGPDESPMTDEKESTLVSVSLNQNVTWATYSNKSAKYPYTVNYPQGWFINETKGGTEIQNFKDSKKGYGKGLLPEGCFRISISFGQEDEDNKEIKTWCQENLTDFQYKTLTVEFLSGKYIKVDNHDAYLIDYQIKEDQRLDTRQICISKDAVRFTIVGYPPNPDFLTLFDQILSTFRFIE